MPEPRAPEVEAVPALLVPVEADLYAVALTSVVQVLTPPAPTVLPGAPAAVLGVINVRGQVVAVLDPGRLLGVAPLGGSAPAAVVVVRLARGLAGLAATGLPRTAVLTDDLGPSALPTADGRRRAGDAVVTLLDLEATLAPERVAG